MNRTKVTHSLITILILSSQFLMAGCSHNVSAGNRSDLHNKRFAIVAKSAGNENMKIMTDGFRSVIEEHGGKVIVKEPSFATNDQTELISSLISQDVSGISVAVNDPMSLSTILKEARNKGIYISSFDSPANKDDRDIFINQAGADEVGRTLVEAVYDISGGEGQWAILSSTSLAPNQNTWIEKMMSELEKNRKYDDLFLVDVTYGDDEILKSKEKTRKLLERYPDLKVICAPTTKGILAAAEVISETGSEVRLTGLGRPEEMSDYIGPDKTCPYIFFWDSYALGKLTAYAAMALEEGTITGAVGESFNAGELGSFTIKKDKDGGTEVVLGPLVRIN